VTDVTAVGVGLQDFMVACMCINRAHIDMSRRRTVMMLQERLLDQLRTIFNEIAQKKPSDKWYAGFHYQLYGLYFPLFSSKHTLSSTIGIWVKLVQLNSTHI
jgi:hypothetical protein